MPNGHGGNPRFFSALMLLVCLAILYGYVVKGAPSWFAWIGYPLAALLGWRFAHGLHLWKVTEYDGAYSSEEAISAAVNKYLVGTVAYAVVAMGAWYFLT